MALHPDEEATIRAFIVSHRRLRYLEQMTEPKRRARLLNRLNHCRDFDPRFATPTSGVSAADLIGLGAPQRCHLISSSAKLDGREMLLEEALWEAGSCGLGTIVCCLPGRLAFFRDETDTPTRELILARDA
jgi:hypothetical protein